MHGLSPAAVAFGNAVDGSAIKQKRESGTVRLDQASPAAEPFERGHRLIEAGVVEPGLAGGIGIDPQQGRAQPIEEQNLAKAGALGQLGNVDVPFEMLPAQRFQLLDKRQLDGSAFGG